MCNLFCSKERQKNDKRQEKYIKCTKNSAIFNTLRQISSSLASTLAVLIYTLIGSNMTAIHGVYVYFGLVTIAIPLYKWLTDNTVFEGFGKSPMGLMLSGVVKKTDKDYKNNGKIKWNFTKD